MILDIPDNKKIPLIDRVKIQLVINALKQFNNNRTKAAKFIGVSSRTIRHWISYYDQLKSYRIKLVSKSPYWDDTSKWKRS